MSKIDSFIVGVLIVSAVALFQLSHIVERNAIRKMTELAFLGGKLSKHKIVKMPLARLHPLYAKWLRQIGSKLTPRQLETRQLILAAGVFVVSYMPSRNYVLAIVMSLIGFAYPLIEIRSKIARLKREIGSNILLVIFLLRIYVQGGCHNLLAVRLLRKHLEGTLASIFSDAELLMEKYMTFSEAMSLLADESPSEELEFIADELRRSAKNQTDLSQSLNDVLKVMNEQQDINLQKAHARQKSGVYTKFMLFFVSPIILLVMCYLWGMISSATHFF